MDDIIKKKSSKKKKKKKGSSSSSYSDSSSVSDSDSDSSSESSSSSSDDKKKKSKKKTKKPSDGKPLASAKSKSQKRSKVQKITSGLEKGMVEMATELRELRVNFVVSLQLFKTSLTYSLATQEEPIPFIIRRKPPARSELGQSRVLI